MVFRNGNRIMEKESVKFMSSVSHEKLRAMAAFFFISHLGRCVFGRGHMTMVFSRSA